MAILAGLPKHKCDADGNDHNHNRKDVTVMSKQNRRTNNASQNRNTPTRGFSILPDGRDSAKYVSLSLYDEGSACNGNTAFVQKNGFVHISVVPKGDQGHKLIEIHLSVNFHNLFVSVSRDCAWPERHHDWRDS